MFGIISALAAASSWTYACHLWKIQTKYLLASQINIIKNIIAFIVFSPVLFTFEFHSNFKAITILLVSGILGIAIGDTFYIRSLKILGTRRTLTFEALSPIIATLLGAFLLNETLPIKIWLGIAIVSISLVGIAFQKTRNSQDIRFSSDKKKGYIFATLSVLCAVIAAILSRLVLISSDLNPFQTTEIRLFGSILALLPFMQNNITRSIKSLPFENIISLLLATILGTNIGILLQQNVFRILPIGIGWTLLSTSPLMALFFARSEGEEINWKTLVLTTMIILGVGTVFI